jgi:HTH-type transcriptional regulator / antitoxin HigA
MEYTSLKDIGAIMHIMQNAQHITREWARVADTINITRPQTPDEYERLLDLIDHITDIVDDPENNPYSALLDLAFTYAHDWEEAHQKTLIPDATPAEMLEFLMQQHGLKQVDLERAGVADQALISNILKGKRKISIALAKRLAAHFGVSSDLFI